MESQTYITQQFDEGSGLLNLEMATVAIASKDTYGIEVEEVERVWTL